MRAATLVSLALWTVCGALGQVGCQASGRDPHTWFPADYQQAYSEVLGCAKSGVHGGPYSITWMSPDAATHFTADGHRGDDPGAFPEEAVLVKAQYRDSACKEELVLWTVMRKGAPELAPESADWEWQTVYADGEIAQSGQVAECIACHRGCEASDYVCSVP